MCEDEEDFYFYCSIITALDLAIAFGLLFAVLGALFMQYYTNSVDSKIFKMVKSFG